MATSLYNELGGGTSQPGDTDEESELPPPPSARALCEDMRTEQGFLARKTPTLPNEQHQGCFQIRKEASSSSLDIGNNLS